MFKLVAWYAAGVPLVDATLMLQREVADRLVAGPGSKQYGVLSILIGHACDVDMVLKLPAGAFRPPPKVLSALVRLRFRTPHPAVKDLAMFRPGRSGGLHATPKDVVQRTARPGRRPAAAASPAGCARRRGPERFIKLSLFLLLSFHYFYY